MQLTNTSTTGEETVEKRRQRNINNTKIKFSGTIFQENKIINTDFTL